MPVVTSFSVSLLYSYFPGTYDGLATVFIADPGDGPVGPPYRALYQNAPHPDPVVVNSGAVSSTLAQNCYDNLLSGAWVANCMVFGSLFGNSSPYDEFNLYDVWACVTYEDGTHVVMRPSTFTVNDFGPSNGTITNPGNMCDNDPTTFGTIRQIVYTGAAARVKLSGWTVGPPPSTTWIPFIATALNDLVVDDLAHIQRCIVAGSRGVTKPTWDDSGGNTTDGGVTWQDQGTIACGLAPPPPSPIPSCNNPPQGTVGVPYTHTFTASSGTPPYTFSVASGFPPGLVLGSDGAVTGTPTTAGVYPFTLDVTDSESQVGHINCSITINPSLTIDCGSPPSGIVGFAYNHTFPYSGGAAPYAIAVVSGQLPPGIAFVPGSATIAGIPTADGTYPFRVQVTDGLGATDHADCSITIAPPLSGSCNSPLDGRVGDPYSHDFTAENGTQPYHFSIAFGLPAGLTVDFSGHVSGTPTLAGTYPFTVDVVDSGTPQQTEHFPCSITIAPPEHPPLAAGCGTAVANVGTPYTSALPASGGVPPYRYEQISEGAGPAPGLSIGLTTGIISGIPTTLGTFTFVWRLTDSVNNFIDTGCSIQVLCPAGSQFAKFQLWSIKYVTEPADKAEVTHSYDFDRLNWPYDKKLKSIMFEYDGSAGDVTMKMETIVGIGGITAGPTLTFQLSGAARALQQFGIPDGNVVKAVRLSPTDAPSIDFKSWKYVIEKEDYPADFVLFTEKNTFGYNCEKIARNLVIDMDTGGVGATVQIWADGILKQTVPILTTSNDRSRIVALNSNLIGREWYLEIQPGQGGKSQLFNWSLDVVREPCAVSRFDTYEQNFGYPGFKWIKQAWLEYQSASPITIQIFVDGGKLFFTKQLPAHPDARDVERFYFEAIDPTNQYLNKSKKYRMQVTATDGVFKLYSDSVLEWSGIGYGQRIQRYLLSEKAQLPVD